MTGFTPNFADQEMSSRCAKVHLVHLVYAQINWAGAVSLPFFVYEGVEQVELD